jgi:DNA-binding GntR family transcriptional regulator
MAFMVDLQAQQHRYDLHTVRRILESEAAARAALFITDERLADAAAIMATVEPLMLDSDELDHESIMEADIAFHHVIAEGANNSALTALIDALANRTQRARLWHGLHNHGRVFSSHGEHLGILAALQARDPDRARLLMGHHLLVVEDYVQDQPVVDDDVDDAQ